MSNNNTISSYQTKHYIITCGYYCGIISFVKSRVDKHYLAQNREMLKDTAPACPKCGRCNPVVSLAAPSQIEKNSDGNITFKEALYKMRCSF